MVAGWQEDRLLRGSRLHQDPADLHHPATGGARSRITLHDNTVGPSSPSWSPDGKRIAYYGFDGDDFEIFTIPSGGGVPKKITNDDDFLTDAEPSWSPDGKRIAFTCSSAVNIKKRSDICTIPSTGGAISRRTIFSDTDDREPAWSPDGERIAYQGFDGNNSEIFTINASGPIDENPTQVTNDNVFKVAPDWQRLNSPEFSALRPRPNSTVRTSPVTIRAKITDDMTNLAKADIELFVNGIPRTTFSYDRATDRLSFRARNLQVGENSVRIFATDGEDATSGVRWSFRIRP